jgi:hypothetical protein
MPKLPKESLILLCRANYRITRFDWWDRRVEPSIPFINGSTHLCMGRFMYGTEQNKKLYLRGENKVSCFARYKIAFLIFRHLADASALTPALIRQYNVQSQSTPDYVTQLRTYQT